MKIANINFKKVVSGMYISDDEKGIAFAQKHDLEFTCDNEEF